MTTAKTVFVGLLGGLKGSRTCLHDTRCFTAASCRVFSFLGCDYDSRGMYISGW